MKKFSMPFLFSILLIALPLAFMACGDDDDDDDDASPAVDDDAIADDDTSADDDVIDDDVVDDDTTEWEPVEPHKETYNGWTIVWLAGTPEEMGRQQGQLLHDELAAGYDWLNTFHIVEILLPVLRALGYIDLAWENSYADVIAECQGLVETAGDAGWSVDLCLLLNFGDILVEFISTGIPPEVLSPGCSQFVATGAATTDGSFLHGRLLDWSKIPYLLDYPVVFVRQPSDGIPHSFIGFPGNISPYSGINAAGLSVASNEVDPFDDSSHDTIGRSHVQMQAHILKYAHTLEEARAIVEETDHMSVELITVADGNEKKAHVFEMSALNVGVRSLTDDILYTTNHFNAPETLNDDAVPNSESSSMRYLRLSQLLEPEGVDSMYGTLDREGFIEIMRDRVDPETFEEYGLDVFDNNRSLATNGAIYAILFDPANLRFWVAGGETPVPQQPYVGFSLGELLGYPNAAPCDPPIYQ